LRVHLAGHLAYYHGQKQSWFEHRLAAPVPLAQVLEQLGVPAGEVMLSVVNDDAVDLHNAVVNDSDTVQFYPATDGG
jgi:hypothetical protein